VENTIRTALVCIRFNRNSTWVSLMGNSKNSTFSSAVCCFVLKFFMRIKLEIKCNACIFGVILHHMLLCLELTSSYAVLLQWKQRRCLLKKLSPVAGKFFSVRLYLPFNSIRLNH